MFFFVDYVSGLRFCFFCRGDGRVSVCLICREDRPICFGCGALSSLAEVHLRLGSSLMELKASQDN